ncbi:hypothetical protein SFUMM280S_04765 [Streptomyces fumanus]
MTPLRHPATSPRSRHSRSSPPRPNARAHAPARCQRHRPGASAGRRRWPGPAPGAPPPGRSRPGSSVASSAPPAPNRAPRLPGRGGARAGVRSARARPRGGAAAAPARWVWRRPRATAAPVPQLSRPRCPAGILAFPFSRGLVRPRGRSHRRVARRGPGAVRRPAPPTRGPRPPPPRRLRGPPPRRRGRGAGLGEGSGVSPNSRKARLRATCQCRSLSIRVPSQSRTDGFGRPAEKRMSMGGHESSRREAVRARDVIGADEAGDSRPTGGTTGSGTVPRSTDIAAIPARTGNLIAATLFLRPSPGQSPRRAIDSGTGKG